MTRALLFILALVTVSADAQTGRRQDVIDPNVATEKELLAVPQLTPPLVKAI
jgi:hypothetical protein